MKLTAYVVATLVLAFALVTGCKPPEAQLKLVFPAIGDAGAPDGGLPCEAHTNLGCVNYLKFTAGDIAKSEIRCPPLDIALNNLCDLGRAAVSQEIFRLPPETPLPIKIEGLRVFPVLEDCNVSPCLDKKVFAGETTGAGKIGDYVGRVLELPITMVGACGPPEEFFFLPDGRTCQEVCTPTPVICEVSEGCLCQALLSAAPADDGGQGGIDGGQ